MSDLSDSEKKKLLTHKQLLDALRQNREEQVDGWLLVKSMVKEMHGEEMMGIELAKLYSTAPSGGPAQRSIMQMMITLIKTFGERPAKENPLGNLDEDQLKRLLVDVLGEENGPKEKEG